MEGFELLKVSRYPHEFGYGECVRYPFGDTELHTNVGIWRVKSYHFDYFWEVLNGVGYLKTNNKLNR